MADTANRTRPATVRAAPTGETAMTILQPRRAALAGLALLALAAGPARAEGNPSDGKTAFRKCTACHTLQAGRHRVGQSLAGLFGRVPGTAEGFRYSPAMTAFGATGAVWDEATVDAYLADPKGFVAGNRMVFPGIRDAGERADLIAFLKLAGGE